MAFGTGGARAERQYQEAQFTVASVIDRPTASGVVFDVMTTNGEKWSCWDASIKHYVGQTAKFNIYGQSYRGTMQYTIDLKRPPVVVSTVLPPPVAAPVTLPPVTTFTSPAMPVLPPKTVPAIPVGDNKQRAMFMSYAKDLTVACINNGWISRGAPITQLMFDIYEDITNAVEQGIVIARLNMVAYTDDGPVPPTLAGTKPTVKADEIPF